MTRVPCPRCHGRGWYRVGGSADLHACDYPECEASGDYRRLQEERRSLSPVQIAEPPPKPRPTDPKALRRVLCAILRRGGEIRIARAIEVGHLEDLSDRERALLDAVMVGQGYLVNGRRVDPEQVEIVRWVEQSGRDATLRIPGTF